MPKMPDKPIIPTTDGPGAKVWKEFFEFVRGIDTPEDWMKERPMNRVATKDRTLFREDD